MIFSTVGVFCLFICFAKMGIIIYPHITKEEIEAQRGSKLLAGRAEMETPRPQTTRSM